MKEVNSQAILARLTEAAGVASSGALSGILGVSSQAVYDAKKKEKIPDSWIRIVAEQTGVSADWLFFGRGPMRPGEASPIEQDAAPASGAALCGRCVKLEEKLEKMEQQRDELALENRQWAVKMEHVLRENGDLRERCATLAGQQKISPPEGPFRKAANTPSNEL